MPGTPTVKSRKLELEFKDEDGQDLKMRFNYIKDALTDAAASSLMDGLIENAAAFNNPPATKVGAKIVTTTEAELTVTP